MTTLQSEPSAVSSVLSSTLQIETPRAFLPLLGRSRYKGAHGGRGSGKSHFFAERLIEEALDDPSLRAVCVREIQKSLDQSVKQLLEDKIKSMGVSACFEILDTEIHILDDEGARCGIIIFQGMQNHTAESIKSLEGFRIAWVEEAQSLSQRSLDLLTPTLRIPGAEIWFTWNPRKATDPVDAFMRSDDAANDNDIICVEVNYRDNPWFYGTALAADMERDKRRDPDKYAHIWLGGYEKKTKARVFQNWKVEEFAAPADARFYFGADWGFSVDPTVLTRCFALGRTLYVDFEAYFVGCDIDRTEYLFAGGGDDETNPFGWPGIPGAKEWPIRADSARPETISFMKKRKFNINAATKGPGSVKEGVEFLKSCDIVVHPRCVHTIDELSTYSYKTDKLTGEVLPLLEDKKNHVIDALRYALEAARKPLATALFGTYATASR